MFKCECCKRKLKNKRKHPSNIFKNICDYCYHKCESVIGLPYCHIERNKIGGYWMDRRSNTFRKANGTDIKADQKEYFRSGRFIIIKCD